MAKNIYDTPEFFAEYSSFTKQKNGLEYAEEWPLLRALLPDPTGIKAMDIGCGFGWFSRWAMEVGAESVRAIDGSENMLNKAREMTRNNNILYEKADLETIVFDKDEEDTYGLIFSSLVLHYVVNLESLFHQIHRVLTDGGSFVFCAEHPIFTAPSIAEPFNNKETGKLCWPLERYQEEGVRQTDWLVKGFQKQHRTMASYINILLKVGFEITGFDEGYLSTGKIQELHGWERLDVPKYLMISAVKRRFSLQHGESI
ncbi:hypothetical protein NW752_001566 [Fusarium irregulare]|uniref:Methyltransferase type 11 domain-containing protein n=1 Tax=Fusarium irregulare TaxID=2494466 RepID=A0A9W8UCS9_9HYPO|nr:hypothetical protein NW766_003727 [Fusarium irregulare]KAJ4026615.1 hypothetical protein NW752_001566 [Fusarium irregulare]